MTQDNYVKQERRFHDVWAIIMYLILNISCISYTIMNNQNISAILELTQKDYYVIEYSLIAMAIMSVVTVLCYRYIPEITIKISLVFAMVLVVAQMALLQNVYSIVMSIIGVALLGLFMYKYWSSIKYIASVLEHSTKILLTYSFSALFGVLFCTTAQITSILILLSTKLDQNVNYILLFCICLNIFWTFCNLSYFLEVYITSIVAYHFVNNGDTSVGVFGSVMVNTLYASGSISYAGLIIALIKTIRLFVDSMRNDDRRETRNILADICLCIFQIILSIFETLLEFYNELAMPYIAIHGDGYSDAMRKAHELTTRGMSSAFVCMSALRYSIYSLDTITALCVYGVAYFNTGDKEYLKIMLLLLPALSLYFAILQAVYSSFMALIYLYMEKSEMIKETNDEIHDSLKKCAEIK